MWWYECDVTCEGSISDKETLNPKKQQRGNIWYSLKCSARLYLILISNAVCQNPRLKKEIPKNWKQMRYSLNAFPHHIFEDVKKVWGVISK